MDIYAFLDAFSHQDWLEILHSPIYNPSERWELVEHDPHLNPLFAQYKQLKWQYITCLRKIRNFIHVTDIPSQIQHNDIVFQPSTMKKVLNDDDHEIILDFITNINGVHNTIKQIFNINETDIKNTDAELDDANLKTNISIIATRSAFLHTAQNIIFAVLNPVNTNGYRTHHINNNSSYDEALTTALLQIVYNIVEFARFIINLHTYYNEINIISHNYIKQIYPFYKAIMEVLFDWLNLSPYDPDNLFAKNLHNLATLTPVDRPLLYSALVYSTFEQHTIAVNILHHLLSHNPTPNVPTPTASKSSPSIIIEEFDENSNNFTPYKYNPIMLQRLVSPITFHKPPRTSTEHASVAIQKTVRISTSFPEYVYAEFIEIPAPSLSIPIQSTSKPNSFAYNPVYTMTQPPYTIEKWLPLSLLSPQQLATMDTITLDNYSNVQTFFHEYHSNKHSSSEIDMFSSNKQLSCDLKQELVKSRINFIKNSVSFYDNYLISARDSLLTKANKPSLDEEDDDDFHAVCLCGCTHAVMHINTHDNINDDEDDENELKNAPNVHILECTVDQDPILSSSLLLSQPTTFAVGIGSHLQLLFNPLTNGTILVRDECETDGMGRVGNTIPPYLTQYNQFLYKIKEEYKTMILLAYFNNNRTINADQYNVFYCTFNECCLLDENYEHVLYIQDTASDTVYSIYDQNQLEAMNNIKSLQDLIILTPFQNENTPEHSLSFNTCGHWPSLDAQFFHRIHPQYTKLKQNPNSKSTNLECTTCFYTLPYIIQQYTTLHEVLYFTPSGGTTLSNKSTPSKRYQWYCLNQYVLEHEEILVTKSPHSANFFNQRAMECKSNLLTQLLFTYSHCNTHTIAFPHHSAQFLLHKINIMNFITAKYIPNGGKNYKNIISLQNIVATQLFIKILYFFTELFVDCLDQYQEFLSVHIRPQAFGDIPSQLRTMLSSIIALWTYYTLLWNTMQLDLVSVYKFSPCPPLQAPSPTVTTETTNYIIPKSTATCSTLSVAPLQFSQPLIYALSYVLLLLTPIFPDLNEFQQQNSAKWEEIKKQKKFSFGNVEQKDKITYQLDRITVWTSVIIPALNLSSETTPSSCNNDSIFVNYLETYNNLLLLSPYFTLFDSTLYESRTAESILLNQNIGQISPETTLTLINFFTNIDKVKKGTNISIGDINKILLHPKNIANTLNLCQSQNQRNQQEKWNLSHDDSDQTTTVFSLLLASLVSMLQTSTVIDISAVADTGLEMIEAEELGEYELQTSEMYHKLQLGHQNAPIQIDNDVPHDNNGIFAQQQPQSLDKNKKFITINHTPRLYKTTMLTSLTGLLCCIPSLTTSNYVYYSKLADGNNILTKSHIYDINNASGCLGLLDTNLNFLIIDHHNPVAREWAIFILRLLTTKITSIVGTGPDGGDNDEDDSGDVTMTDNQLRLLHISEQSKNVNAQLSQQGQDILDQAQMYQQQQHHNRSRIINEGDHQQMLDEQIELRDEILNTPGVNIVTGWETHEMDEQFVNIATDKDTNPDYGDKL